MRLATWVVAVATVSAVGDGVGLLHQLGSDDRPPVPAMLVAAVLAVGTMVSLPGLRRGQRGAWRLAAATRALDALLLVAAAGSGHVFGEAAAHVASAVLQFALSLTAAALLVTFRAALLAQATGQPPTVPSPA
ncbi:MAG: hypothetical protein NVS3B26_27270 [Mycobacteriales bacterium]